MKTLTFVDMTKMQIFLWEPIIAGANIKPSYKILMRINFIATQYGRDNDTQMLGQSTSKAS